VSETRSTLAWCRFLGNYNRHGAEQELKRLERQLSHGFDLVSFVLRSLAGSPSADVEEILRVAQTSIDEAMRQIASVRYALALGDSPDAA
jgi:hypothetical protein